MLQERSAAAEASLKWHQSAISQPRYRVQPAGGARLASAAWRFFKVPLTVIGQKLLDTLNEVLLRHAGLHPSVSVTLFTHPL